MLLRRRSEHVVTVPGSMRARRRGGSERSGEWARSNGVGRGGSGNVEVVGSETKTCRRSSETLSVGRVSIGIRSIVVQSRVAEWRDIVKVNTEFFPERLVL